MYQLLAHYLMDVDLAIVYVNIVYNYISYYEFYVVAGIYI